MRARGAEATDIVILVVAADDGVMPQTVEAISHAKAADVPIVVAINKIDRESAQPDRVKQQLSEHGLIPQDWGGDTEMIPVSALTGEGVDDLLETILLVADVEDLKANPEGRAAGVVIESHLDIGRGPVANILVQRGTLKVGEPLVAGPAWGRVRALINDHGEQIKEAGPSTPVQVLGLNDVADAGDTFVVAPDEKTAKSVAEKREHWHRVANLGREAAAPSGRLEDIFEQIQRGDVATLNILLKADTTGSLEALTESLRKLEREDVKLAFVHRAVGGITQQDVQLAATSGATIIGFNVRPDRKARELAQVEEVEIRTYEIIYQVARGHRERHGGHARPRVRRGRHRRGRGPGDLLRAPDRQDRRLLRPQRHDHPQLQGPLPPRGHDHLEGHDQLAPPLQGGRPRGPGRLRVRHRAQRLPGPQAGRHHRDLRGARDPSLLGAFRLEEAAMPKRTRRHSTARDFPRTARLNRLYQEILAEEIELLDDDRLQLVTVMSVDVDGDLKRATVYLESLGGEADDADVMEALEEVRHRLQSAIGRQARVKRTPELIFRPDDVSRGAARVEEVLRSLHDDEP